MIESALGVDESTPARALLHQTHPQWMWVQCPLSSLSESAVGVDDSGQECSYKSAPSPNSPPVNVHDIKSCLLLQQSGTASLAVTVTAWACHRLSLWRPGPVIGRRVQEYIHSWTNYNATVTYSKLRRNILKINVKSSTLSLTNKDI